MGDLKTLDLSLPQLLTNSHVRDAFHCGHQMLDAWLLRRAIANQATGASRTYVIATSAEQVIGYCAIAPTSLDTNEAVGSLRRNAPSILPMYLLGRLAVDVNWSGHGLGSTLLKHAQSRALEASVISGGMGLLCHALDERSKAFYINYGFAASPGESLLLMKTWPRPTSSPPPPSS